MILFNSLGFIETILPAGLVMLALGMMFAIVLLIASEKLKVKVDEKVEQIYEALPQIDCGACGMPGCRPYAKAVVENTELIGKCAPGGAETAEAIGNILNLQISESGPAKRPIVHCRAHSGDKGYRAKYEGIPSCVSANALSNAQSCKFGCLGYGDCVSACKFDALEILDDLATVDYYKCTGCGACSHACPRDLIDMIPFTNENMVTVSCRSNETGKDTRSICKVGCIACGICVKQSDLFAVTNNLANVDYAGYDPSEAVEAAVNKCPTCVIVYRGKDAPLPREPKVKQTAKA